MKNRNPATRLCAVALASLLLLSGCAKTDAPADPTIPDTSTTAADGTAPTTAPDSKPDPAKYNRLTGEYDNAGGKSSRVVAVMIGNNPTSRPQVGLANADLFVEAETEGGITRIMAVFADASRVPAQLCPIRSARSPFVLMAQSLDAVYIHAGGSQAGLQTLANSGVGAINALNNNGDTFWRDKGMQSSRGQEYSLSTGGEQLTRWITTGNGFRVTSDRAPFAFGTPTTGDAATQLQVVFSGVQTDSFVYDAGSDSYKKYIGALGSASAHITTDNATIQAKNVLVMYDTKYAENSSTISFNLASGNGILCSGGKVRNIQWKRTASGLSFTENGSAALFAPGKTYICLVNKANQGSTLVR